MTEETSNQQANPEAITPGASNSESLPVQQVGPAAAPGDANHDSPPAAKPDVVSDGHDEQQDTQNANHATNGASASDKKTEEEPKRLDVPPLGVSANSMPTRPEKNQPSTSQRHLRRVGANQQPVRLGSPGAPQKPGERKDLNRAAASSGQGEAAATLSRQSQKEKPAQSEVTARAKSAVEKKKFQIKGAMEFIDPTEPLGTSSSILPLGAQVNEWISQLSQKGLLLLQCVDENVLRSAGYAIANAEAFSSWRHRALKFGPWKWAQEPDKLHKMLFHDRMTDGGKQTLIVVFGYWRNSEAFLQVLPEGDEIESVESRKRDSLRIVVLVTPERLRTAGKPVPFSQEYAVPPLDFLYPLLSAKFPQSADMLVSDLRQQFEKNLWGNNEEEFHKSVRSFLRTDKLEAEIENRNQLMKESDPGAALKLRQSELGRDMLNDDTPLENAVLFAATYFEELPADDFQRVLTNLLGERTMDIAVLTPVPAVPGSVTPTVQTRPKLLRQIWSEERQAILRKCRLCILDGNPRVVGFESGDLRNSIQKRFESEFFFLFDELCERVIVTRLFFDDKEAVSKCVASLFISRIKNDPSGYGPRLLPSLVLPLAPGINGSDEGTLEKLRAVLAGLSDDRRRDVLNRLGTLLNSLVEEQASSVVEGILRVLVDLGRHDDVLQLLSWIIHPSFLPRRIELLKRIVNEGTAEIRDKVGRHIVHWARTGGSRTAMLLQALHGWCDNSNTPSAAAATQFFVQLCALCVSPPATWERQPIALALATAESEICFQDITSWLLSLDASSAKYLDVEDGLGWLLDPEIGGKEELQFILALIITFLWIMPRASEEDALLTILGNGDLGEAILIIWFSSYERALMAGLPGSTAPDIYAGTLRSTLVADCAIALRSQISGSQDRGDLDRLARAVARMERRERATLLAHWAAMAAALGDCLTIPRSAQFALQPESAIARNKLIERWTAIRNGLIDFRSRVLAAVASTLQ